MKKFFAIMLALTIMLSIVSVPVFAADNTDGDEVDTLQTGEYLASESAYSVLYDNNAVVNYLKNEYSEYSSVTVGSMKTTVSKLNVYNFSQTTLNTHYNALSTREYEDGISGTCAEVAITMMTDYMIRAGKISTTAATDKFSIFNRIVHEAYLLGWDGSGTLVSMINDIMDNNFENYTPVYSTDHSTLLLQSKLEDSIKAGIPAVVNLDGHSVTGVGFVTVDVTYTSKNIFGISTTKTETEVFLVINNGWHDATSGYYQYSYVPFDDVKSIEVPEK